MQITLDWSLANQVASFALSVFSILLSVFAMQVAKADSQRTERIQEAIQGQLVEFSGKISGLVSVTQILERNSVIVFERVIGGLLSRDAPREGPAITIIPKPSERSEPLALPPPAASPLPTDSTDENQTNDVEAVFERASNPAIARKYVDIVRNAPGELLYSKVVSSDYDEYARILDHLIANGILIAREDRLYVV